MKKISILSGGLDSTVLTYSLVHKYGSENVIALSFNYGQRHSLELNKAITTCKKLGIRHEIIDISFMSEIIKNVSSLSNKKEVEVPNILDVIGDPQPPTYVPYRNMLLTTMAFTFAESNDVDEVYLGIQQHDEYSYWDTTIKFVEKMNRVSSLNRTNSIKLVAPFVSMSKQDEIEIGEKLNVPWEDTWTCYTGLNKDGEEIACGTCPSCSERIQNFLLADVEDKVKYNTSWNDIRNKYLMNL
jgi:7-cyano-7-deazaguanine synthase